MPTLTSNFSYNKPLVNNATDADLWGGQLNTNWDDIDTDLAHTPSSEAASFNVASTEFNFTYLMDGSSAVVTATLPSSIPFAGFVVRFKAVDTSNTLTVDGNGNTIDGSATLTLDNANDLLELTSDGTNWTITTSIVNISHGKILQLQSANIIASTGSTTFPNDNTTPLISEGTEIVTDDITPSSTSSTVKVSTSITVSGDNGQSVAAVLFRDSTAIDARVIEDNIANQPNTMSFNINDTPATISAVTYSIRVGSVNGAGSWFVNRLSGNIFNGVMAGGDLILEEVGA